ncbi:coiled-coil domain-containing protein 170 isoform X1 [Pantherophis guttatus]|uniref:Coiled-coil domain-containing protein 170 isoform X1 n=1 Tax=Pantherophis guttatus TaxID=94885 RepID=A0ABM3ZIS5_PANGU|nr:coiled-coil domain-containing protein 170 isoform X1 [Pantherophis guttatus]
MRSAGSSRAGSACSRLIDVTSNAPLLRSPDSVSASSEAEQRTHNYLLLDVPDTREQLVHYRNAAETASSELAALLVKYECAQAEILDLKSRIASQEVSIQEFKAEVGGYKENDARQSSLLFSMQHKFQELEKESGTIAISKHQAELKSQAILQENLELKEKIYEQEEQIKKYLNKSEESKSYASKVSREQNEFIAQLCHLLEVGIGGNEESPERLLSKIRGMRKENDSLKEQIDTFRETITIHEMELKANRETIMRLVSEVNKEQKKAAACSQDIEKLSDDLSNIAGAKQNLEEEIRSLQNRLAASQRAWEEFGQLKVHCNEKEMELRTNLEQAREEKKLHNEFKDQIVALLGSNPIVATPSKEDIVEKIRELCHREESKKRMVSQLEAQISKLTETLETQTMLHQEALQRAKKSENKSEMLHDQLMRLEGELVSGDVMRDAWKLEKQQYLKFLDQLSEKMNLDRIAVEVGFDMRLDAVLARAEQLIKLERDTLTDNKIMVRNLQRKVKAQKEQLENKELHVKLLRQKIVQLDEEKQVRTALAVERDEANLTVRKLQKKIDRLQNELSLARETHTDLKVKLADTNELKIKAMEQDKTIEELSKSQEKLEKMKTKAEKQLTSVQSELHVRQREAKEDKEKAKHLLESVTTEATALKSTLEEVMKREKQLADFRRVISLMLGLNIATVALPDYEIVTRLEGLIHSHQHHCSPCACFKCQ